MNNIRKETLELHEKAKGKLEIALKVPLRNKRDMTLAYTPGVAEPCLKIVENRENVYKYTIKGNSIAIVTDGSAVLGLGNIGPEAALPVMEGKAILFKELADIDAFPLCLKEQDIEKTIATIKNISPSFGGINLEDIKAPECFEIEERLQDLGIPVMHDDQHCTAIVTLAALINSLKVVNKNKEDVKIVINGAGAAGIAIAKILYEYDLKNIIILDSKGIIYDGRQGLNKYKQELATKTNQQKLKGTLKEAILNSDIFIGVSVKDALSQDMIKTMNSNAIIIAMANPDPEILPEYAKKAGAAIVATGRSDYPNQVNNVLAFPGVFKGALESRVTKITTEMKIAAAEALADTIKDPNPDKILPYATDKEIVDKISSAIKQI